MSRHSLSADSLAKVEDLRRKIVAALEQRAIPGWATVTHYYDKNPDYVSYGLRAAAIDEVIHSNRQSLKGLAFNERLYLAEEFFKAGISEQASVGNHLLAISTEHLGPEHFEYLDRCIGKFHGWGSTDGFCIYVLQPVLLRHRDAVLRLLNEWNRSDNLWKRRASVVAFTRKAGASGDYVDEVLRLCENLIWDEEDLVQKGVGWALKDNLRGAKEKVVAYVKDLRARGVPSTITLYAIRDLKGQEREEVLAVRGKRAR
jgi:3-methyladenine DNA glycosylase AlkD